MPAVKVPLYPGIQGKLAGSAVTHCKVVSKERMQDQYFKPSPLTWRCMKSLSPNNKGFKLCYSGLVNDKLYLHVSLLNSLSLSTFSPCVAV